MKIKLLMTFAFCMENASPLGLFLFSRLDFDLRSNNNERLENCFVYKRHAINERDFRPMNK